MAFLKGNDKTFKSAVDHVEVTQYGDEEFAFTDGDRVALADEDVCD